MTGSKRSRTRTVFFDIGGVLLTNGWDRYARGAAAERFRLDPEEFTRRHYEVVTELEAGRMSLAEYLARVVFHSPREFTPTEFRDYMFARSAAHETPLALVRELAAGGKYRLATLNNESRELNEYRIERFGLREIFDLFVSSCYVGVRKPDPAIYRLALDLTQRDANECVFVDDRPANVAAGTAVGLLSIQNRSGELRHDLARIGIEP